MPLSYWIDLCALAGVCLVAFALALDVFGLDPRLAVNRYFALFSLSLSTWAASSAFLSQALRSGVLQISLWVTLVGTALYLAGPALMLFANNFLDLKDRRIAWLGILGLLLSVPIAWLFAAGRLISSVTLNQYGIRSFIFQPLGRIVLLLPLSILFFTLYLFLRHRGFRRQPYLILAIIAILFGLFAGAIKFPFPLSSLLNFFAIVSFGWAVLRVQILNPLLVRTLELQRESAARQAANRALIASEERYRTLFEAAGDAILLMDDQKFVDCNRQALALFACERKDLINATPETFSPSYQPDGRLSAEAARARISACLTGATQHFDWIHQRADGVTFDAEITLNRVFIGSRIFIQAIVRDISARKTAAAAQAQRHALESLVAAISTRFVNLNAAEFQPALKTAMTQILEYTGASQGVICLLDSARTTLECLISASRPPGDAFYGTLSSLPIDRLPWLMANWQTSHQVIQTIMDSPPPDSSASRDQFYALLASAGFRSILIMPVHKFDRLAGMLAIMDRLSAPSWAQAAESIVQLLGELVSSLIERQAMQQALEASEERLELALEGARLGLWDWNIITGMVTYNHTWAQMLGYNLDEITPDVSGWESLVHPADLPEVQRALQAHLEGKTPFYETEHRMRAKNGSWKWILDRGRVVARDDQGNPLRAAGTHLDLSARKQAEHERNRLASIIEATTDFVAITGPDLTLYYLNQAARRVLGLASDADLRSYQLTDFLPSWAAQQLLQEGLPAAGQHGFWTGESAILSQGPSRQIIPVSQLLMLHRDKAIASELYAIVMRDIRERIENERRIQNHVHRLRALHQVGSTINASLNLQVILGVLLEQALNLLDVSAAAVMLYNPELHMLTYAASRGLQPAPDRRRSQRASEGFAGRAVMERRRVIIPSLSTHREVTGNSLTEICAPYEFYLVMPLIAKGNVQGVLEIYQRSSFHPDEGWLDFVETLSNHAAIAIDNLNNFTQLQRSNAELRLAYDATITGWSQALELRAREPRGHTEKLAELTQRFAQIAHFPATDLPFLRWGVLLHDIGTIAIPDAILLKPGPLNEDERQVIEQHPQIAFEMLAPITYLQKATEIPYAHHERWNGSGYPRQLTATDIPLSARMFAIVDVYDALCQVRPYRAAWKPAEARLYLQEQAGVLFDPELVSLFFRLLEEG